MHVFTGFPTQVVDVTGEGISTAGFSGYTLICNTSREPDLPPTSTLAVEWLHPRGNVITNGTNFTISGAGPTTDISLISSLVFNSLYTSQAGEYTCRTLETIPGTVVNHPESETFTIQVQSEFSICLKLRLDSNLYPISTCSYLTSDLPSQSQLYPQYWYLLLSHLYHHP